MKIYIRAKPKSKKEYIKMIDLTHYTVSVKEPPVDGKANTAIIKALAAYFNKAPSTIYMLSGMRAKQKIVDVPVTKPELEALDLQRKLF